MDLKDKKTENTLNARFYLYFCSEQLKNECMRLFQSSIFRALCSVVMGVLVIMYPVDITRWLVVAIGLMFLLSGIVSCVAYFYARKQAAKAALATHISPRPRARHRVLPKRATRARSVRSSSSLKCLRTLALWGFPTWVNPRSFPLSARRARK